MPGVPQTKIKRAGTTAPNNNSKAIYGAKVPEKSQISEFSRCGGNSKQRNQLVI